MQFQTASVDQKASFIYFVYPFLFETKEFEARVQAIKYPDWFSIPDRENLDRLVASHSQENSELWEAIATWSRGQPSHPVTAQLVKLESARKPFFSALSQWGLFIGKWVGYFFQVFPRQEFQQGQNYQKQLLAAIAPPTGSQKQVEAFIELLIIQQALLTLHWADLRQKASEWPEDVEKLAEEIGTWCRIEGRSQIYAEWLDRQKTILNNNPSQASKGERERLLDAINFFTQNP